MKLKKQDINCGIVTFHRAHNYGAVLQAYALQKAIENLGYNVAFIDEQHKNLQEGYSLYPTIKSIQSIRKFASYFKRYYELIRDYKRKKNRYDAFEDFINNKLKLIPRDSFFKIDNVVLGSDQIWNAEYTNGVDKLYFGFCDYIKCNNTFSYAASMGMAQLSITQKGNFERALRTLNSVGVREKSLQDYIKNEFGVDNQLNLDPTLLIDKEEWSLIASDSNVYSKPYLLIYEVHAHEKTNELAKELAEKYDLEIKVLAPKTDYRMGDDIISDASPCDFISLFRGASYIITTSFHGTVFSIINQKPFTTMSFGNDIDLRSRGLLKQLNLENRIYESNQDILEHDIDYQEVDVKLEYLKDKSLSYLSSSLV